MIRIGLYCLTMTLVVAAAHGPTGAAEPGPPDVEGASKTKTAERRSMSQADRAGMERQFREMLTGAVFKGTWRMTALDAASGKSSLGEPHEESYAIADVSKLDEEHWLINARIQYGDKDVTIPVTVRVVWAGDTPIITLDNMSIPLLGTYSARVMVYRGYYCGTWFGANYGGVMSGEITKLTEEKSHAP